MDSFKTLFEKKQYDLIIQLTKKSNNVDDFLYCVSAFVAKGMFDEALKVLDDKKEILEKLRLPVYMKMYVDILCITNKFDEAFEKVKYFEYLPYYSQEAEEVLRSLNGYINEAKLNSIKNSFAKDEEEIIRDLMSNDSLDVIDALNQVRDRKIDNYVLPICRILTNFPKQSVRSIALMVLVETHYSKKVKFLHQNIIMDINPSNLKSPFDGKFQDLNDYINGYFKDPSLNNVIMKIFTTYIVYYYPDPIPEDDTFIFALLKVACNMLNIKEMPTFSVSNEEKLEYYISLITTALNED